MTITKFGYRYPMNEQRSGNIIKRSRNKVNEIATCPHRQEHSQGFAWRKGLLYYLYILLSLLIYLIFIATFITSQ
jgi:hypothetical protein